MCHVTSHINFGRMYDIGWTTSDVYPKHVYESCNPLPVFMTELCIIWTFGFDWLPTCFNSNMLHAGTFYRIRTFRLYSISCWKQNGNNTEFRHELGHRGEGEGRGVHSSARANSSQPAQAHEHHKRIFIRIAHPRVKCVHFARIWLFSTPANISTTRRGFWATPLVASSRYLNLARGPATRAR